MGPHHLQGVRKSDRNAFSFCNFFFFFPLRKKNNDEDLEPRDLGSSPGSAVRLGPRSQGMTVHGGTPRVSQQRGLDGEPVRK